MASSDMTAKQIAEAKRSWAAIMEVEPISSKSLGIALWASIWAERLLNAVEAKS